MKKTNRSIVSEMINSNMLDFEMDLETVRGVIDQMKNDEMSNGLEVGYDVNELVTEYRKQYIQMT